MSKVILALEYYEMECWTWLAEIIRIYYPFAINKAKKNDKQVTQTQTHMMNLNKSNKIKIVVVSYFVSV